METPNFVQVKEATIITPFNPTPHSTLPLSTLDSQLFLRFTVEYLLIYPPPTLNPTHFLSLIKSSLSKALVPYYPLSGRVINTAHAQCPTLELECRAQGVVFVEAVSGYSQQDFDLAPRHVDEWRQLLCFHVDDVLAGGPVLVVQLTWLADGAVAIAFGFNHVVCDGIGAGEFINYFADLTRDGFSYGPKPVWDRYLLNPNPNQISKLRSNILSHPEFNRVQDCCSFLNKFTNEQLIPTSNIFNTVDINKLKISTSITPKYTTFEIISAHIWKCWAKSLKLPSNQTLKLLFSTNIRNKIKPGLPSGFYGNGFVLGCAQTTVKELTEKGLGYGSGLIKRAKESVDDKYVREVIEIVSGNKTSPDLVGVLILSQWSRLGLERADFGLGKPAHIGPICSDKYCLLLPVQNQKDSVRVMLALPTTSVDLYQHLLNKISF